MLQKPSSDRALPMSFPPSTRRCQVVTYHLRERIISYAFRHRNPLALFHIMRAEQVAETVPRGGLSRAHYCWTGWGIRPRSAQVG
jgi:hypothetical protein